MTNQAMQPLRRGIGTPRNIAIMIGQLTQGGSERQLYNFLAHCDRSAWTPVVYVSGELGYWEGPIRALNIPIVLLTGNPLVKMVKFRSDCIARKVSCFFSWSSYTNGYGLALIGRRLPRIGSFRNAGFSDLPDSWRGIWSWMSVTAIETAVCNSRETLGSLQDHCKAGKSVVFVPNAVQTPEWTELEALRAIWRARLGLLDNTVMVLGVGRLVEQKNFARFIDAVALVRQRHPIRAFIAGRDFGYLTQLEEQVARLGLGSAVQFIGTVPNAAELMCAADIFLLSSDHEGMPNVVAEAMGAAVPCVATKVNGVDELIVHGKTGFVAEPDANALAQHLTTLAVDDGLRKSMGALGREKISRQFQPEEIVPRLWSLCETQQV